MAGSAAAGTAVASLGLLNTRIALAEGDCSFASFSVPGFGPISPVLPENTAALGDLAMGDLRGIPLLRLPKGFHYTAISIRGQVMSDGVLCPGDHDGMACFSGPSGTYTLIRNHELSPDEVEDGNPLGCLAPNGNQYDPFRNAASGYGGGGTTNVVVNRQGEVVEDYVSLGGTIRNCAGGPTSWGSWISCEENVTVPDFSGSSSPSSDPDQTTVKHGYNFEVPKDIGEAVEPIPLIDMGRFNHEAVSVDPRNGITIYQTEDRRDSCYYKFVPNKGGLKRFGALQQGGTLYAMAIDPDQVSDCNGARLPIASPFGVNCVDTRGLDRGAEASMLPFLGQPLKVKWVRIDDVDPEGDTLRFEAQAKGATIWWRGEGAWYSNKKHYWVNSGAGDAGEGQVVCYDPRTETVTLVVESTDENLLDGPDNITASRDGTLYLCEDGSGGDIGDANYSQYVVGVDPSGGLFQFAHNIIPGDTSEFAGACFSPDGRYMFVNNQGLGITYCIWHESGRAIELRSVFNRAYQS